MDNSKNFQQLAATLDAVSKVHLRAEKVERYLNNPHVQGDNVATHLSRALRLATYAMPYFQAEFPAEKRLAEEILLELMIHDDGELGKAGDIATFVKNHDQGFEDELRIFQQLTADLSKLQKEFLAKHFLAFRVRDRISGKLAKIIDNLAGNALAIEQEIGLIQPDYAGMCVDYVKKYLGVSEAADVLINKQIEQILDIRKSFNQDKVEELAGKLAKEASIDSKVAVEKILQMLQFDIINYKSQPEKAYIPLLQWQ